ncbi:MAG: hypothetical protein ACOZCL_15290 [Bacillota bacterium]
MKWVYRISIILHVFLGIGGMAGGLAAITDPIKPLGISAAETLKNSPFDNFLIPGILLFTVIGLGNLFGAVMFRFKTKYQAYISGVLACGLMIWIIVQCIMILAIHALHIIFFGYGLVQGLLAAAMLFEKKLFPADIITEIYKKMTKSV